MGVRGRSSARLKRLVPVLAAVVVLAGAAPPVPAGAAPEDDLRAAQARADRAADELADAEEELARAQDSVAHVQTRVDSVDARVSAARARVRDLAIRLYVEGTVPVIRILRMADANDVIRAQQYSHVVAGSSTDSLRQYRADREDLGRELAVFEDERESHAESLATLRDRRFAAMEEIDRLGEVVARVAAAEEARRAAEVAATAGSATSGSSSERSAASTFSSGGPSSPTTATPVPESPVTESPEPEPEAEAEAASDWICPVQGPLAFSDDYGAPRGGGFSHQGNDILAARGTPVVASVGGDVRHRSGAVSGLAYYLDGDDGNQYFGAHLDSYGASGRVDAGTVVGYVGNTGDAASTAPHLHFEIHPGGSGYENPYPTLVKYC